MADGRKKDSGESVLEFFWDSLELASDKTYSTTLRVKLTGWWEGGKPREVGVSIYQRGQEPPAGDAVRIQKGFGFFPLTGLEPGHHYLVVVYVGDRLPVQKMITVPELLKPSRKIELLGMVGLGNEVIGITICRLGKDGKPESGEVSAFDGLLRTWTVKPDENEITAVFKLHDRPRKITFFLPDDREVKASAEVPAKSEPAKEEKKSKKVPKTPLFQRIRETYQQERDKGKAPEVEASEEVEVSELERSEIDFSDIDRVLSDSELI